MKARYIVIPVIILGAVALTTWALVRVFNQPPKYDLLTIRRGAVAKTVSVAGSVISDQKFDLGFLTPDIVQDVKVKVGDQVKANDVLVALDTSILREQANQARAGVAAASALLAKTRNRLQPTDINVLNRSLDSARIALDTARRNLQDAYRLRDTEINGASMSMSGADSAYQNALNAYRARVAAVDQGIIGVQMTLTNATNALNNAQNAYNQILNAYNRGQATFTDLQQAQTLLTTANSAYLSARSAYDTAVQQANLEKVSAWGGVEAAQSQLNSARAAYNSATVGADLKINNARNALAAAESAYNLASAQYQQSLAPTPSADIAASSAQVAASAAALRVIEAQIAKSSLKAPIDGVVTAVNVKPHELSPMTGPAIVVEAEGAFQIEAFVSEIDVEKITAGADVKVVFDALPGVEAKGTMAAIEPAATIVMGVVNYKVRVALVDAVAGLKSAMTADLEILTDKRDDVLFVPRQSLTKSDSGYTIKVLVDGKPEVREVQVGLIGDSEAEIVAGLAEGDQIVLKEL